jgi:hypothetical protein
VRVVGVGLAVVPRVEQAHPGGQLGRDVDDVLTGLEQPLGQGTAGTVGALDRQVRSGQALTDARIAAYPALSVLNRPRPSSRSWSSTTTIVADSLWGSTPMTTSTMLPLPPAS